MSLRTRIMEECWTPNAGGAPSQAVAAMALWLVVEVAGLGRTVPDNRGAGACPLMGLLTAES